MAACTVRVSDTPDVLRGLVIGPLVPVAAFIGVLATQATNLSSAFTALVLAVLVAAPVSWLTTLILAVPAIHVLRTHGCLTPLSALLTGPTVALVPAVPLATWIDWRPALFIGVAGLLASAGFVASAWSFRFEIDRDELLRGLGW